MFKIKYKKAKSLCVAILSAVVSLNLFACSLYLNVSAEDDTVPDPSDFKYTVTIDFGPMTFYYDYGTWDAADMRYEADAASGDPANGTETGFPGWYGFDGKSNAVSIKYTNQNEDDIADGKNQNVGVSLSYSQIAGDDEVSGVEMKVYSDSLLENEMSSSFNVPSTDFDNEDKTTVYISLSGAPVTSDGSAFTSGTFVPVGMLTITVREFSD